MASAARFFAALYRLWLSRPIPEDGTPRAFEFSTDARSRWCLNLQVALPDGAQRHGASVGIDLGLKALATLSDGTKIEVPRFHRERKAERALLQRRGQSTWPRTIWSRAVRRLELRSWHCSDGSAVSMIAT